MQAEPVRKPREMSFSQASQQGGIRLFAKYRLHVVRKVPDRNHDLPRTIIVDADLAAARIVAQSAPKEIIRPGAMTLATQQPVHRDQSKAKAAIREGIKDRLPAIAPDAKIGRKLGQKDEAPDHPVDGRWIGTRRPAHPAP